MLAVALTPAAAAEAPPSRWMFDRWLQVSPQAAPHPSLRYRLLPLYSELKEGNAVPIYLRLIHEQNDAARKYWTETPQRWNALPVDKIPLDEAREFLRRYRYFLRQFDAGARRRTAEWNYTLDLGDPIGMLLPDAQVMRGYAPLLVLQVRVALAEGDFTAAAHHIETGFAFSRHVGDGPFLISNLVGLALARQFSDTVADFVERPDAPNLYWSLAALPRPLIDMRHALDLEYRMLEMQFPQLADLDRERTSQQWDAVLRHVRADVQRIAVPLSESPSKKGPPPVVFPRDCAPTDPASKCPDLPAAREYVARARNLTAEKVDAMAPAQLVLLYMVGCYHEWRDELFRVTYLSYPQARALGEQAMNRLRDPASVSEGKALAQVFLPAIPKVIAAQSRAERNLAALRVVEALRLHAAAHKGRLPDRLDEITEISVPDDPATGKPFAYSRDKDTATLTSEIPGEPAFVSGIRYRVTIRQR
jgi:hypothetical protein